MTRLRRKRMGLKLAAAALLLSLVNASPAAINWTGDVDPADPTTWTSGTSGDIGDTADGAITVGGESELLSYSLTVGVDGNGTLTVEAGGTANNAGFTVLGSNPSSTGVATVTGSGSRWDHGRDFVVGRFGDGTLTVEAGGIVSNRRGYLGVEAGSTGLVTVTGSGSEWNNAEHLEVGGGGDGTLIVEAGGIVRNTYSYVGGTSDSTGLALSTGTATITGSGSQWHSSDRLYIASSGNGTLNVNDGAVVSASTLYASLEDLHGNGTIVATSGAVLDANLTFDASGGTQEVIPFGSGGALTVTAGGGDLGAGYKGSGTLTIADGVAVAAYSGYLGRYRGSTGVATVTGSGSGWSNSQSLVVGQDGSGALTIAEGGAVSNSNGSVGHYRDATGAVTVTGSGSQWTNSGSLEVGSFGVGTLTINAGGIVSNTSGYMGSYSSGRAVATVAGIGSQWNCSTSLYVGRQGSGTLNVEAGGTVNATLSFVGDRRGSTGMASVTGRGSQWTSSAFYVGFGSGFFVPAVEADGDSAITLYRSADSAGAPSFDGLEPVANDYGYGSDDGIPDGVLTVSDGGEVASNTGYVGHNSSAEGRVSVVGVGSSWTNQSHLTVGHDGAGTLSITAEGLVTVGGTLTIDHDIDGDGFLNIATGGMLAIAGDVDASITEFLSIVEGSDAIRYWDVAINNWSDITLATPGVDYTLEYFDTGDLAGYTQLTVHTASIAIAGDYNGDGAVDALDYSTWRENLGNAATAFAPGSRAVGNGGPINDQDYQAWLNSFGAMLPQATPAAPEPAAVLLLVSSLVLPAITRRRFAPPGAGGETHG